MSLPEPAWFWSCGQPMCRRVQLPVTGSFPQVEGRECASSSMAVPHGPCVMGAPFSMCSPWGAGTGISAGSAARLSGCGAPSPQVTALSNRNASCVDIYAPSGGLGTGLIGAFPGNSSDSYIQAQTRWVREGGAGHGGAVDSCTMGQRDVPCSAVLAGGPCCSASCRREHSARPVPPALQGLWGGGNSRGACPKGSKSLCVGPRPGAGSLRCFGAFFLPQHDAPWCMTYYARLLSCMIQHMAPFRAGRGGTVPAAASHGFRA